MVAIAKAELGVALAIQGRTSEAMSALHEGLQLLRQHGLIMLESYLLSVLGVYYALVGDWSLLGDTTEQGLALSQSVNSALERGFLYSQMALFAEAVGDYPRALEYIAHALEFSGKVNDASNQIGALIVRGRAQLCMGTLVAAKATLHQAYKLTHQLRHMPEMTKVRIELGHLALEEEAWQEAEQHFSSARTFAISTNLPYLAASLAGLARVSFQMGQLEQTLSAIEEFVPILLSQPLETQYGAMRATLVSYQIMAAHDDARAHLILQRAVDWLHTQATKISDESLRQSFLEKVPHHRQLLALFQEQRKCNAD